MDDLVPILLILALLWWFWRQNTRPVRRPGQPTEPTRVLPCAYCGVYVPEPDAISLGGKSYCSRKHSKSL